MNRQFLFCQIGSHKNGKWFLKKWKNLQKWFPKKRKTLLYTIYIQNKTPLFPATGTGHLREDEVRPGRQWGEDRMCLGTFSRRARSPATIFIFARKNRTAEKLSCKYF